MRNLFNCDGTNLTDSVRAVLKKNSPLTYVKPGMPPFLLINGSADKTVPLSQTEAFHKALQAVNADSTLLVIPEGQHRISDWKKIAPDWQHQVAKWLADKLAEN